MKILLAIIITNLFYWPSHRKNDEVTVRIIKAITSTFISIKMTMSIMTMTRLHISSYIIIIFEILVLIVLTKPEKT